MKSKWVKENFEKTSDACLVDKHFGEHLRAQFYGSTNVMLVFAARFKDELLTAAKLLEIEESEKAKQAERN